MRGLEERLGLRLRTRTTRSVAPTEAGGRLLCSIGPRFQEIEAEVATLGALREEPAGNIRHTASEHAAEAILRPVLTKRATLSQPERWDLVEILEDRHGRSSTIVTSQCRWPRGRGDRPPRM
jgi:DNA-binding transcriptional LysR family regulator